MIRKVCLVSYTELLRHMSTLFHDVVSARPPGRLPTCLHVCLSAVGRSVSLSACLSLPVCLLPVCLSVCLPNCMSVCLSVSAGLSVCLSACLPVCLYASVFLLELNFLIFNWFVVSLHGCFVIWLFKWWFCMQSKTFCFLWKRLTTNIIRKVLHKERLCNATT